VLPLILFVVIGLLQILKLPMLLDQIMMLLPLLMVSYVNLINFSMQMLELLIHAMLVQKNAKPLLLLPHVLHVGLDGI
jgi:hypothetical protein